MKHLFALTTGLIFGTGIAISSMIYPAKSLIFFDVSGTFSPSLTFVMGGALLVILVCYRLAWRRSTPQLEGRFQIPTGADIDMTLVGGSALFGVGWGIAGFYPGAAIPALGTGRWEVALFTFAVAAGFFLRRRLSSVGSATATN